MFTNKCEDNLIPTDSETCYEAVASQEEIYLEEVEEEVRVKLTSYEPAPPRIEPPTRQRK